MLLRIEPDVTWGRSEEGLAQHMEGHRVGSSAQKPLFSSPDLARYPHGQGKPELRLCTGQQRQEGLRQRTRTDKSFIIISPVCEGEKNGL